MCLIEITEFAAAVIVEIVIILVKIIPFFIIIFQIFFMDFVKSRRPAVEDI